MMTAQDVYPEKPLKVSYWLAVLKTAFLTCVFVTPFASGSPLQIIFVTSWIVIFILLSFLIGGDRSSLIVLLRKHHAPVFYLLLLFFLWSIFSLGHVLLASLPAGHKTLALIRYVTYLLFSVLTFAIARFVMVSKLSHVHVYLCYMAGTVVLALILLAIYQMGGAAGAKNWGMHPPVGTHVRMMGIAASVSIWVAVMVLLWRRYSSLIPQVLLSLALFTCSSFLVWTGSRASLLLVICTMSVGIVLLAQYRGLSKKHLFLVLMILLMSLPMASYVSVFSWNGLHRMVQTSVLPADESDSSVAAEATADQLTSGRMTIWRLSWREVKRSPWLGLGPYGYFFIPDRPRMYDHPHNLFLQFSLEWGLPGCMLLLALIAGLLWYGLKRVPEAFRQEDLGYVLSAGIVLMLTINGLVDGTFFVSEPLFCLALAFSCFPFLTARVKDRGFSGV